MTRGCITPDCGGDLIRTTDSGVVHACCRYDESRLLSQAFGIDPEVTVALGVPPGAAVTPAPMPPATAG